MLRTLYGRPEALHFRAESRFRITGSSCFSFSQMLLRFALRMEGPPLRRAPASRPLSHGPRICVLRFQAVISCWGFLRVFCEGRKHRGGALETESSLRSGMTSAPPHLALCQGHWGRHVTEPDLRMQKSLPAPTLAKLVPSYCSQFCCLKPGGWGVGGCWFFLIRSDDRKDLVDTELQQNLQLGICDIPDMKKAGNAHSALSYLNSAPNQGCFIKHLEL